MNGSELKQVLKDRLSDKVVGRELDNIISYYVDATRSSNEWDPEKVAVDVKKLLAGEPVQYVTGVSFFYGHRFQVSRGVLIPRPETEELVHWILTDEKGIGEHIVDIGVGSGCILLSVLAEMKQASGVGVDISPEALKVFQANAIDMDLNTTAVQANVLEDELTATFAKADIIVSNPPYIAHTEIARVGEDVLAYEPSLALFVEGPDPLLFYKHIINECKTCCAIGTRLYFESSDLYHKELLAFVEGTDLAYKFRKDLQGKYRMFRITI